MSTENTTMAGERTTPPTENTTPPTEALPSHSLAEQDAGAPSPPLPVAGTALGADRSQPSPVAQPALDVPPSPAPDSSRYDLPQAEEEGSPEEEWKVDHDGRISVDQRLGRNDGVNIGVQIVQAINRLRGDLLPPKWIAERLSTYERPEHERDQLRSILNREHVLVLHASESAGRYTAALAALHREVGNNIRHVRREPGEVFAAEGLEGQGAGWILDLRDEGDRLPSGVGPALRQDALHLKRSGSYLIVLTDTEAWRHASKGTDALAHALPLPASKEVLRAHLEKATPPVKAARWLDDSKIAGGIAGRLPAEVVEWARAICEAEYLDPDGDFKDLVDAVVQAAEDWRTRLLEWHTQHEDSAHRNYLLAASVLDGAPVETIYAAAETLAEALGETPAPRPGQQGLGVIALTQEIKADLSDEDTVCFRRPGYVEAVVDYFWADRPHLIQKFTRWTADQTSNKDLPDDVANQLASRVTGWALKYMRGKRGKRATELLREIAGQWAQPLPEQARDLLTVAALDTGTGRRARDAYLAWARRSDQDIPPYLKVALAKACECLADIYPTMMLLRLTELAAHTDNEDVTNAVGQALTTLWDQPKNRKDIQSQLAEWSRSPEKGRRTAAHLAFLHLAARTTEDGSPVLLASAHEDMHRAWQAARWRGLLVDHGKLPPSLLQQALSAWMNAATYVQYLQDPILTILQHAVYEPQTDTVYAADRYLALNHLLFAWAPVQSLRPPSEQEVLRDQLLLALRNADPAVPAPGPHVPED
ncbi:hypothetical protein [Streptomyces sp. NPDC055299]